jgi:hypothetical protein
MMCTKRIVRAIELKVDHFAGGFELRQIQRRNYTQVYIEKKERKRNMIPFYLSVKQ